jgi:hypothetical protein
MTKEEKDLLLNDLCARLRYGVKISVQSWDEREMEYIDKVDVLYSVNRDEYIQSANEDYDFSIEDIKPYLLPLSSMTEGQKKELQSLMISDSYGILYHTLESFNYMCKNNIDFRGLIPKGLAIDATGKNIY